MNFKPICLLTIVAAFMTSALPGYTQPTRNFPNNDPRCTFGNLLEWQNFCDRSKIQPIQNYQPRYFTTVSSLRELFNQELVEHRNPSSWNYFNIVKKSMCADTAYNVSRLLDALVTMYEATGDTNDLKTAIDYADKLLDSTSLYESSSVFERTKNIPQNAELQYIIEQIKRGEREGVEAFKNLSH